MSPFALAWVLSITPGMEALADAATPKGPSVDSQRLVLVAPHGTSPLEAQIARTQDLIRRSAEPSPHFERLGWLYVSQARRTLDPGYYTLAEHCARCLDPESNAALLLRGHVLASQHQFKEAEALARKLVARRESAPDHGLLGDCLLEQGRTAEALAAYQKMVDLKPDLHSYSRAGHMRWLKGDLTGAIEVMRMAVRAGGPHDAEATAWTAARLAMWELQAGAPARALMVCESALKLLPEYPPLVLARSRIYLAENNGTAAAVAELAKVSTPLPEYLWALAEAQLAAGQMEAAAATEARLLQQGARTDPRLTALFLATRRLKPELALQLAQAEARRRGDVATHDALAWALAANGRWTEAWSALQPALAEGTAEARFFFHAAVIGEKVGRLPEARHYARQALQLQPMLFPTERAALQTLGVAQEVLSKASRSSAAGPVAF